MTSAWDRLVLGISDGPAVLPRPPEWMTDAACRDVDKELFFSRRDDEAVAKAKAVCATCPVIADCLEYALTFDKYGDCGIWGGTTRRERLAIRRGREADDQPDAA